MLLTRAALGLLSLGAVACGDGTTSGFAPHDEHVAYETTVIADDGTEFAGNPVIVQVVVGWPQAEVNLLAHAGDQAYTSLIGIEPVDIRPGASMTAVIRQAQMSVGVAYLERQTNHSPEFQSESGTIQLHVDAGRRIRMRINTPTKRASASVDAAYVIRCMVAPSDLGLKPNGHGPNGEEGLIVDEGFVTDFCAPYREETP